ncbi:MAG: Lrp/AsnC family transcriptional regulator [Schwartzia sp.]|nr:Lrp/AsnC family transcriptional regulator [Schwartzia sp. (in: firmicutes)]
MNEILSLLAHDARRPVSELAAVLRRSEYEVEKELKALEKERIIYGYNTLIDWNKAGENRVTAFIGVNLTPQRDVGFDAVADRIARFDEVQSVYLMSGNFDLLVVIEESSMQAIADFIAQRLATIEGVTSTRSHFMLKTYKKNGLLVESKERDRRLVVSP